MDVSRWKTTASIFPWPHVQRSIDGIDPQVFRIAMEDAQRLYLEGAHPCPGCGRAPQELFWLGLSSPEETWDAGAGGSGFLTICEACQRQVDFFADEELTEIEAENWREGRFLSDFGSRSA